MNKQIIALLGTSVVVSAQASEIDSITSSEDWNTLKIAWRTLNRTAISEDQWNFSITTEKGDSIRAVVNSLFPAEFSTPEITRAVQMLKEITILRTTRQSRINPMLMTRMMPPWTATVQEDLLFDFESRLHTLSELLLQNEISASEFIAGRDSLLDKAMVISLMESVDEILQTPDYGYPYPDYRQLTPDSVLHRLDMTYRAALDSLNRPYTHEYAEHYKTVVEQHERFLEEYSEFQEALPLFRTLLETLMEAEF